MAQTVSCDACHQGCLCSIVGQSMWVLLYGKAFLQVLQFSPELESVVH
jgi:hypothetical protein